MENKNLTAVDWYFDKMKSHFEHDGDLYEVACMTYQLAKEKEKEQMIKFAFDFYYQLSNKMEVPFNLISENRLHAETYYNETYKQD
jgi:hypothetical protein